uniref:Isopentenyltransferase n=1 Tax=Solanum tuberosum TaxID=4113 RepID=M1DRP3_SOLTU
MGETGTGKSSLSVDLATHFRGEIINSDKMQVFKGLEIVTNKNTDAEKQGVRHYLLGEIEPDSKLTAEDLCLKSTVYIEFFLKTECVPIIIGGKIEPDSNFTAEDFCVKFIVYLEIFLKTECVPIIVGGSNSYIEKLVEDHVFMFKYKYDSCFSGIDVEQSLLNHRVDTRVDEMVNAAKMNSFINNNNNKKVVFIMGATGMGKSRLSVDLATYFRGKIFNLDKVEVFKVLEIVTDKITHAEKQGVPHHLLGEIEPDSNFTAENICLKSIVYIAIFLKTQCVPIIVGGSNSFIEKLVEDVVFMFKYKVMRLGDGLTCPQ